MKKTNMIIKDTFREIKKTKGRFFSIFAIVMIGVSFFAGIMSSGPTMRKSADHYFDEYNLMDYRILFSLPLKQAPMPVQNSHRETKLPDR